MNQYLITLILSVVGFLLAWHIWHTKANKKELYCVIGKDCNVVIHSEHAKIFGVENTVLGMLYYVFTVAASLAAIFYPAVLTFRVFAPGFLTVAGLAAAFSLYLAGVQLFKLKEFCEYCLANTAIVLAIFVILLL